MTDIVFNRPVSASPVNDDRVAGFAALEAADLADIEVRSRALRDQALVNSLRSLISQAPRALSAWGQRTVRRWRTERMLEDLSDQTLADIGVSRHQIPELADFLARHPGEKIRADELFVANQDAPVADAARLAS